MVTSCKFIFQANSFLEPFEFDVRFQGVHLGEATCSLVNITEVHAKFDNADSDLVVGHGRAWTRDLIRAPKFAGPKSDGIFMYFSGHIIMFISFPSMHPSTHPTSRS